MKTTELVIEPVMIGLMVIAVCVILWVPFPVSIPRDLGPQLWIGSLLIGAAYILGIVFDRVFDTLMRDFERQNRLRYLQRLLERAHPAMSDPYPEEKWHFLLLHSEDRAAAYAEYLRSRIRLTRSLTLLPAFFEASVA